MAGELSSNWKRLQAQIKGESTAPAKRKAEAAKPENPAKRPKARPSSSGQPRASLRPEPSKPTQNPAAMGNTQSSVISKGSRATVAPSLALWAADNDITTEALAEAYGLGVKDNALLTAEKPRINEGLAPNNSNPGKYIAIDCEMVGVGPDGYDNALARVSVVDFHGRQVYDSFVRPKEKVTDWRTSITGITPKHMATARDFDAVQGEIAELLKGRIVVGHDIRHDLAVLLLSHSPQYIRDTSRFAGYKKYGHGPKPALRVLAREVLGVEIQTGHHSSIEDARTAMLLFRKKKSDFDVDHANRYERVLRNEVKDTDDDGKPKPKAKSKARGAKKKKKN